MKITDNIHISLCMCIVALFVMMPFAGYGMEFKLNESLYKLYVEANRKAATQEGLVLADSLRRMSIASGSHIGEVLALCVPVKNRFYKSGKLDALEEAVKVLQDKSLQYGYIEYYYYAMSNKLYYLAHEKRYQTAVEYMKQELQFAKRQSHPYGVFVGYNMLGIIHQQRGEFSQAVKNFEEALTYCKNNKLDQSLESTYKQICSCYRRSWNFEGLVSFTEKELRDCKDEDSRAVLVVNRGLALFMLEKDAEFVDNYNQFKKIDAEQFVSYRQIAKAQDIFKLLIDGKSESAETLIEEMEASDDKTIIEAAYYKRVNNFLKAMDCMQQLLLSQYRSNRVNIVTDMADLNAILGKKAIEQENQQKKMEKSQLELAHTQLLLNNMDLELQQSNGAKRIAQLDAERKDLVLKNQTLEAKRLENKLKTQKYDREAREREMTAQNSILITCLIVSVLLAMLIYVFLQRSIKISKKVKNTNEQSLQTFKEIKIAKDKAIEADRMKTVFVRSMSHEIRTPLNSIVGFSQVLVDMDQILGNDEKKDLMNRIADNSKLLSALVNDILDLTSIESGRYVMKMQDVKVNEMCRQALGSVAHYRVEDVELLFETDAPDDYVIETDVQRSMSVIINMLTNAEKNTQQGKITLGCSLSEHQGMVTFSVADTGIGVPKDEMKGIFERFKKLDTFKQGTGLGLYICRTIAEKLGGEINIDPEYTGGARFWFTLPVKTKKCVS